MKTPGGRRERAAPRQKILLPCPAWGGGEIAVRIQQPYKSKDSGLRRVVVGMCCHFLLTVCKKGTKTSRPSQQILAANLCLPEDKRKNKKEKNIGKITQKTPKQRTTKHKREGETPRTKQQQQKIISRAAERAQRRRGPHQHCLRRRRVGVVFSFPWLLVYVCRCL